VNDAYLVINTRSSPKNEHARINVYEALSDQLTSHQQQQEAHTEIRCNFNTVQISHNRACMRVLITEKIPCSLTINSRMTRVTIMQVRIVVSMLVVVIRRRRAHVVALSQCRVVVLVQMLSLHLGVEWIWPEHCSSPRSPHSFQNFLLVYGSSHGHLLARHVNFHVVYSCLITRTKNHKCFALMYIRPII
jgi:hypothetical protein